MTAANLCLEAVVSVLVLLFRQIAINLFCKSSIPTPVLQYHEKSFEIQYCTRVSLMLDNDKKIGILDGRVFDMTT